MKIFLKSSGESRAMIGTNVTSLLKIQDAVLVPRRMTISDTNPSAPAFDD